MFLTPVKRWIRLFRRITRLYHKTLIYLILIPCKTIDMKDTDSRLSTRTVSGVICIELSLQHPKKIRQDTPRSDIRAPVISRQSRVISRADRRRRAIVVPVGTGRNDVAAPDIGTVESHVIAAKRPIAAHDITVVARNTAVVSDLVAGLASEVVAEGSHACVELLEDDRLGLDIAYLFSDYPGK